MQPMICTNLPTLNTDHLACPFRILMVNLQRVPGMKLCLHVDIGGSRHQVCPDSQLSLLALPAAPTLVAGVSHICQAPSAGRNMLLRCGHCHLLHCRAAAKPPACVTHICLLAVALPSHIFLHCALAAKS